MWCLPSCGRYPLKVVVHINPHAQETLVPIISTLHLVLQPACLLAEYATIWKAHELGAKGSINDVAEVAVVAYPILGAWFYHRSLRTWSEARKVAKKAAAAKRGGKPAVYQI